MGNSHHFCNINFAIILICHRCKMMQVNFTAFPYQHRLKLILTWAWACHSIGLSPTNPDAVRIAANIHQPLTKWHPDFDGSLTFKMATVLGRTVSMCKQGIGEHRAAAAASNRSS